jgi:glycosyltransferase involved in cell wall biosynthesis
MKVLLSAFACVPDTGSEGGVGWWWAHEIAERGHDVTVITRASLRERIERGSAEVPEDKRIHFAYHDLPRWARRFNFHVQSTIWQWGAYKLAKRLNAGKQFDLVHHITFVAVRLPSFMGRLGIPFVFGPVGGGESAPYRLRAGCGLKGWLRDVVRDMWNLFVRIDPLMRQTFARARMIVVTSRQTRALLPRRHVAKSRVQLAIGVDPRTIAAKARQPHHVGSNGFRVLYIGNLAYWKGMYLGFEAFAQHLKDVPDATLSVVGSGSEEAAWRAKASGLGLDRVITWTPRVPHEAVPSILDAHDILLYPSLHDSGAMVVLEAMARGLPVVALKLGGPGRTVNETCGVPVEALGRSRAQVISDLADGLTAVANDPQLWGRLSEGAIERARFYAWNNVVDRTYGPIEAMVGRPRVVAAAGGGR